MNVTAMHTTEIKVSTVFRRGEPACARVKAVPSTRAKRESTINDFSMPTAGSRINPANKAPIAAPTVFVVYTSPTVLEEDGRISLTALAAEANATPKNIVGRKRKITVIPNLAVIMFGQVRLVFIRYPSIISGIAVNQYREARE